MKPSILVTRALPSTVMARLDAVYDVDRFAGEGPMPREEMLRRVAGKPALVSMVTDAVDAAVLAAGTDVTLVANVAVGYNNVDVAAATARGIIVTNTPDVLTDATADFTLALILAVTRRLGEGERLVLRGAWTGWAFDQLWGGNSGPRVV